jgi:hypothetical protein
MALINLYKVTKTLTELLKVNVGENIDSDLASTLQVTAVPPEKVDNVTNQLNLFLYHISEDAYYKNMLGPGSDVPNVAKTPMALNLFYILTVHHEGASEPDLDMEEQQKLMGYALKTFHDFPVITDQTEINGTPILDADLQGKDNSLEVILRPVSPEDAIAFWGSEDTRTVRLSAYYEVRVVMLEPEPPKTMPGIVLNLGTYLVQLGTPQLTSSQSLVQFQLPALNGGGMQQVTASPARVTLDSSDPLSEAHNRFELRGTNLAAGISRSLVLKNSLWAKRPPPEGPVDQVVVDSAVAEESNWQLKFAADRVTVQVAPTLTLDGADALTLLPGIYSASVQTVQTEQVINNQLKQIMATSNEVSFAIAPRIASHDNPDTDGTIQINLGDEFDLTDAGLELQVVVAGEVYEGVESNLPSTPGQFVALNDPLATPANSIKISPSANFDAAIPQPFQLIINGAESAPFWIEVNPP